MNLHEEWVLDTLSNKELFDSIKEQLDVMASYRSTNMRYRCKKEILLYLKRVEKRLQCWEAPETMNSVIEEENNEQS